MKIFIPLLYDMFFPGNRGMTLTIPDQQVTQVLQKTTSISLQSWDDQLKSNWKATAGDSICSMERKGIFRRTRHSYQSPNGKELH